MSEPVTTADQLPWLQDRRDRHDGTPHRCPRCDADLMTVGIVDLAYVFDTCTCDVVSYPHLVEQMWHARCHAAQAGEQAARQLDRVDEAISEAKRLAFAGAQRAIMREASRGEARAPAGQHLTYTGGLRRAARLVDAMLGEVMDGEAVP